MPPPGIKGDNPRPTGSGALRSKKRPLAVLNIEGLSDTFPSTVLPAQHFFYFFFSYEEIGKNNPFSNNFNPRY